MKTTGFIHCATIGNWEEILIEQIVKIKKTKLYEFSDRIHLGILGTENFSLNDNKFIIHKNPSIELAEEFTLGRIQKEKSDLVWYIHTKGVSKHNSKNYKFIKQWRKTMEYIVIDKFKECVEKLKENDVCGCFWNDQVPHFSGNFWWANLQYINKLEEINSWCKKNFPKLYNRFKHELWVGSGNPKVHSFIKLPQESLYISKKTIRLILN